MSRYLLALDQGTTSSRAILFDEDQNIVSVAQKEFTQYYPNSGWVEHNPMEIYSSIYGVMMEVITQSGVQLRAINGIGLTHQRETTILWDKKTGSPVSTARAHRDESALRDLLLSCRRAPSAGASEKRKRPAVRVLQTAGRSRRSIRVKVRPRRPRARPSPPEDNGRTAQRDSRPQRRARSTARPAF